MQAYTWDHMLGYRWDINPYTVMEWAYIVWYSLMFHPFTPGGRGIPREFPCGVE